jgi:guanine deaminase
VKKISPIDFMRAAVAEARRGVAKGEGGPFGAVVVKGGVIIARGCNRVVASNDPTAHAEIVALRRAAKKLGRFHLADCEIFTTCEPCPMCLAALQWARIRRYQYGCTRHDAARMGFADNAIYVGLAGKPGQGLPRAIPLLRDACHEVFEAWRDKKDKIRY